MARANMNIDSILKHFKIQLPLIEKLEVRRGDHRRVKTLFVLVDSEEGSSVVKRNMSSNLHHHQSLPLLFDNLPFLLRVTLSVQSSITNRLMSQLTTTICVVPSFSSSLAALASVAQDHLEQGALEMREPFFSPGATLPRLSTIRLVPDDTPAVPLSRMGITDPLLYHLSSTSEASPLQIIPPSPPLQQISRLPATGQLQQAYDFCPYPSPTPSSSEPFWERDTSPSFSAIRYHPYPLSPKVTVENENHGRRRRQFSSPDLEVEADDSDCGSSSKDNKPTTAGKKSCPSLAPEVVDRMDAIFLAYLTYLCSHRTRFTRCMLLLTADGVSSVNFDSGCYDFSWRSNSPAFDDIKDGIIGSNRGVQTFSISNTSFHHRSVYYSHLKERDEYHTVY